MPATLDVAVIDAAGKPIEGAFVMVMSAVGGYGMWGGLDPGKVRSTLTGADGRAKLDTLPAVPWRVSVQARGYVGRTLARVKTGPLSLRLERGGAVIGTVRAAETRQPVAGARVRLGDALPLPQAWQLQATRVESITDAQGRFRLEGAGRSPVQLVARAAGFGTARRNDVRAGEDVDLFLFPGATLRGTVRDEAGLPVAGALVRADSDRSSAQAETTDAQGAFTMAGILPGEYVVTARGGSRAPGITSVVVGPEGEATVSLELSDGGYATGQIVDADGRPLAARVRLEAVEERRLPQSVGDAVTTAAAADGRFALGPLPIGSLGLGVSAARHGSRRVDVTIPARGRSVDVGVVALETGLTIRGTVRDADGAPVPGAQVAALFKGRGERSDGEAVSDSDGTFVIAGLHAGMHEVNAAAAGFAGARTQAEAGGTPVVLVLQRGGEIVGRVADGQGAAVEDADVEAEPADGERYGPRHAFGRSDEGDGRFALRDMTTGSYVLQVRASGRGEATLTGVRVAAGRPSDVGVVALNRGGVVQGTVVDADGEGIPGATVHLEKDLNMQSGQLETQTGASGGFELRGVPAGRIHVLVRHPAFATPKPVVAEVDPEKEPVPVRVLLVRGARLEGRAQRRDGSPFTGGRVTVNSLEPGASMNWDPAAITPDGSFVVDHLPPGRAAVNLMAFTPSSAMVTGPASNILTGVATQELELREAETTAATFALRDVIVSGHVTRGRQPLGGVHLSLRNEQGASVMVWSGGGIAQAQAASGPPPLSATTREDGSFELLVFTPGRYHASLIAAATRQAYPGRLLEVPDAERYELELEVGEAMVSGMVVDKETGDPVPAVHLSVFQRTPREQAGGEMKGGGETGPDGRFNLAVEPGELELRVEAPKYRKAATPISVGAGGLSDVRVELEPGLEITGRVLDEAGRPQPEVEVAATDEAGSGSYAQSLADGSYRLEGLDARPYALAAGSATRGFAVRTGVRAGTETTLTLRPGGRLAVRVVGPDGKPVKGAWLHVRSWEGARVDVANNGGSTDASGTAELAVPAGRVEVGASTARAHGSAEAAVGAGEMAPLEIQVKEAPPP